MEVAGKRLDDDIVSELCEPCQEGNVSTQADGYCNDCEEYMCQACFQSHVKMKVLRNHVLGALDAGRKQETQSRAEKCKKHTTENIKYYCRNHDSVACGDCLVFDHRKCEPEFIRDLAKNITESSDFKNILKEVENLADFKIELELSLGRNRKENTEFHDKAIHEIQKCRAEMNTWLDNVTSKIEGEEIKIWKENEIMVSKLEDWIKIINDMINEVRDEISPDKYIPENLFIRLIECKSKLSEFVTKSVPEIKLNLDIKPFAFEPNQKVLVFKKSENLGIVRVGRGNTDVQTSHEGRQKDMTCVDESEHEDWWAGPTNNIQNFEYPSRAELEEELENIRQKAIFEKEDKESLQQAYNILKKELEAQEAMLTRERENSVVMTKERDQTTFLLKQEISSLKDLNTTLNSKLDSRNKEYGLLETRYGQNNSTIHCLQSELKKTREDYESLSRQIHDLQLQRDSANKHIQQQSQSILHHQQKCQSARRGLSDLKVQLKQKDEEQSSVNGLNTSLKSQLDSYINQFKTLQSSSKARQEQDHTMIQSLQSELQKIRESHEMECESLSSQIRDLQWQMTDQLSDPEADDFVGKRVQSTHPNEQGWTGTVTAVDPSGKVYVKWDNGWSRVYIAGAEGDYWLELL